MVNVSTEAGLRAAILAANAGGDSTINIVGNIALTQSLPMITADLTVNGNGADIDGSGQARVFFVESGTVSISNLHIAGVAANGGSGGNSNGDGGGGGGGGLGAGAAVFVNTGAVVTLTNVSIQDAAATGGQGGAGGSAGSGGLAGGGGGGLGGDGGDANGDGGGGGGYEGAGGNGAVGAGGGGGEFGQGGDGGSSSTVGGGGGGGGQAGNGGSSTGHGGGGGGGAINNGTNGGASDGGTGGSPQGGNGGALNLAGNNGLDLGGGGGGGVEGDGGNGGLSGGGGGAGSGGNGGTGGTGGGGGGGTSDGEVAGAGGDFGGGGGSGTQVPGGAGGFGGGGGGAGGQNIVGGQGGQGGFGAGGGGGNTAGSGGSYAGEGGSGMGAAGGGGAALGGAVFVREGGTLILNDMAFSGSFSVTGGGTSGAGGATAGEAHGAVMFLDAGSSTSLGVSGGKVLNIDQADDAIAGAGALTKVGAGTLALWDANSYTGGTHLDGGTLHLVAAHAAGTGAITFGDGSQTLVLTNNAIVPGNFGNAIASFGYGDSIDLPDIPFEAALAYNPATGQLTFSEFGTTYSFTFLKPASIDFVLEDNGTGGVQIVLGDGVTITGTKGDDKIDAKHTVTGEPLPTDSADLIDARGGEDRVSGLGGNDWIIGGSGDDFLKGGKGDDRLEGGAGNNKVKTGAGEDVVIATIPVGDSPFPGAVGKGIMKADAHVRVLDFNTDRDTIELDADAFLAVGATLDESEFRLGRKAKDDDDHILYDADSGRLLYDDDGKGGNDAVQFARLDKKLDLGTEHFLLA